MTKLAYVGRSGLNLLAVLLVLFLVQGLVRGRLPDTLAMLVLCVAFVAMYLVGVRWFERRVPNELAARAAGFELAAGLAMGLGLFGSVMLVLWILGVYHPTGWGGLAPLAAGFLLALLGATTEEILFRGFLFRVSERLMGLWGALALTSALFGAAHIFNPGASVGSALAIALEAGLLLGAAYALKERLWLPIGLHLGWNFAEGSVFGMSVSGGAKRGSLILGDLRGSNLLTGGAFGPENSIVAVVLCLAAAVVLLARIVAVRRSQPPG
jgi:uncharacterized protein